MSHLRLVVDDKGATALHVTAVPHLSLTGADLLRVLHLKQARASEKTKAGEGMNSEHLQLMIVTISRIQQCPESKTMPIAKISPKLQQNIGTTNRGTNNRKKKHTHSKHQ